MPSGTVQMRSPDEQRGEQHPRSGFRETITCDGDFHACPGPGNFENISGDVPAFQVMCPYLEISLAAEATEQAVNARSLSATFITGERDLDSIIVDAQQSQG